jgi:hypothetical protein
MTDQRESTSNDAVIAEALGVIDAALGKMMARDLVSSGEVTDLLLDVRTLLTESSTGDPEGVATARIGAVETVDSA